MLAEAFIPLEAVLELNGNMVCALGFVVGYRLDLSIQGFARCGAHRLMCLPVPVVSGTSNSGPVPRVELLLQG